MVDDRPKNLSARCKHEAIGEPVCRKIGTYSVPWLPGEYCYQHAVQAHVERSRENRVKRLSTDRFDAHYGVSVPA